ncbi:hypothetical protein B0H11DRAFT_2271807 [Mycena galericulata]|nr:hypothetical protein B0H11DRAFT_2271807 [Mycena galericulata]
MAARDLLHIFTLPANFNWVTTFPEPGLNEALLSTQSILYAKQNPNKQRDRNDQIYDVIVVREVFHHFWVPEDEVDERMAAMNMQLHWRAIIANVEPDLEHVPRRQPGDTGPFIWAQDD